MKFYEILKNVILEDARIDVLVNQNPDDLANLIPLNLKDDFYEKVREVADFNAEEGKEISLTQKQLIDICVMINGGSKKKSKIESFILETKFGNIFLN